MLRISLLAFMVGTAFVHGLAAVPTWPLSALGALACLLALAGLYRMGEAGHASHRRAAMLGGPLLCLLLGVAWTSARVDMRLADGLSAQRENVPVQVVFRVSSLPAVGARSQRFEATLIDPPAGVPRQVLLGWFTDAKGAQLAVPGQVWRAQAIFKRPHGNLNPDGFDYEAYLFERNLRATGNLRGKPRLVGDEPFANFGVMVQRARHALRAGLQAPLQGTRYGSVIAALAVGDQANVEPADWAVFSRTGITHLVSISGMHVTLLAALAGAAMLAGWKRWSWRGVALPQRSPAQIVAAAAAVIVAFIYCLLAGWGVPAQRTFFMLAVVAAAAILRLPLSGSRVLILAAALVTLLDPWASLAPGFWLSFGAVAMLMVCGSGRWRRRHDADDADAGRSDRWRRVQAMLGEACRLQLILTIGMIPLVAFAFQQISLVSPLANALAIPVVSFIVTPMALIAMFLCVVPGLDVAGGLLARGAQAVFELLMVPVQALADVPFSVYALAAPPWPLIGLACMGVAWALQPRGLPGRRLALLLLLPVLVYQPARPQPGDWRLTALDVGQGASVVIETAHSAVVYDTGPGYGDGADAGARVVWPYLRARGIRSLDTLVVSHGDLDHAGGVASILAALPVRSVTASYDLPQKIEHDLKEGGKVPMPPFTLCLAGQSWTLDGVSFSMLHPPASPRQATQSKERNAASCVLKIEGRHHSALLTGDIGSLEEQRLSRLSDIRADVVMAPHHGSRNASTLPFVTATQARHAFAQAGYLNGYGHPHSTTVRRWEGAGAILHRTDLHGAIVFESRDGQLDVSRERETRRRVWHTPVQSALHAPKAASQDVAGSEQ
jgi:competence protein ComEC